MEKMVKIRSQEGQFVEVKMEDIKRCRAFAGVVPLSNTPIIHVTRVKAKILRIVFVWLELHPVDPDWLEHAADAMRNIPDWEFQFFETLAEDVSDIIAAAQLLKIPNLILIASAYLLRAIFKKKRSTDLARK